MAAPRTPDGATTRRFSLDQLFPREWDEIEQEPALLVSADARGERTSFITGATAPTLRNG